MTRVNSDRNGSLSSNRGFELFFVTFWEINKTRVISADFRATKFALALLLKI
jgi:hypothetical protein